MSSKKPSYSPVADDDDEKATFDFEQARQSLKSSNNRLRNWAFLIIPTVVALTTAGSLLVLAKSIKHSATGSYHTGNYHDSGPQYQASPTYQPSTTHPYGHSCGHTAAEARARGCIFDTISFAWLIPECYDAELVEEFSHLPNQFPFFADPAGTHELPWSEVEKGERAMFVPWSHHLWHCGFLWRKMHRAIINGKPVDSYIGNYTHTEHCTHIMVEENRSHGMEEVNTIMALKFPYCGPGLSQWYGGTNFTAHEQH